VKAAALAAAVAALTLPELDAFVRELPHAPCVSLCALCDDRVRTERAERAAPAPVVLERAPQPGTVRAILTAPEAADYLRISLDTLYARVERGELVPLPRPPKGRLHFARAALDAVASGADLRYTPRHDPTRRTSTAPAPRLDTAGARERPRGDGDDRRPLGARGAGSHGPRHGEPWAPGQAAWRGPDPGPHGGGS